MLDKGVMVKGGAEELHGFFGFSPNFVVHVESRELCVKCNVFTFVVVANVQGRHNGRIRHEEAPIEYSLIGYHRMIDCLVELGRIWERRVGGGVVGV